MKKWLSSFDTCDICTCQIKGAVDWFVDGKVKGHSSWALMCPSCFNVHGVGIKYGEGQKYDGTTGILLDGGDKGKE